MFQQIALCLLVAVGIVLVSADVSNAWQYWSGSSSFHARSYSGHFRHRPITYRQYKFDRGHGCHSCEYERMRAMYGFLNL